jgi:hypothetical protein
MVMMAARLTFLWLWVKDLERNLKLLSGIYDLNGILINLDA